MPPSSPCPGRVQLLPLLWKSYPIGKWRPVGREELDLESSLRCSGHLPPWVLFIS